MPVRPRLTRKRSGPATSQPFCRTCDRLRLTADGVLLLCLYAQHGTDIRRPLRAGAGLDNSTIYRRIKAILAKTGVSTERHGSRSLRNSFAVRELNEGAAPELIEERLGLRDARSITRYVSAAKRDQA